MEFVDTNVLVYAYDPSSGDRHAAARALVDRLWEDGTGGISVQVLQEFFVTVTRKVATPLTSSDAANRLRALSRWTVHSPLPGDVVAAAELSERYQLSFWDAMILRSASQLGSTVLWSEDLNAGQVIDGVEIRNPLT